MSDDDQWQEFPPTPFRRMVAIGIFCTGAAVGWATCALTTTNLGA